MADKNHFEAAQCFSRAIRCDQNFADAYFLRGEIYLIRWDWDAEKHAL
ncbi:MAG: tetratricopeptide repeat protein [Selenomonadaceae bacterium]|nr:tetratricopeptide repeat protein [Selenomonadaceae bacterium]